MKVIFLDIDGVLVNRECLMKASGMKAEAHPGCIKALNAITDATGAAIVVSSIWRLYQSQADLRGRLKAWGVTGKILGATPDLTAGGPMIVTSPPRGVEIRKWIDSWNACRPNVERLAILDDDADMEELMPYLVRTRFECGLTMEDANRAIQLLSA